MQRISFLWTGSLSVLTWNRSSWISCALAGRRCSPTIPTRSTRRAWIPFQLHKDARVRITIYDVLGREVRGFDLGYLSPGYYKTRERAVYWDGRNNINERVASGTYFYRLEAGDFVGTHRMVILK